MAREGKVSEPTVREWLDADDLDSRSCGIEEWARRRIERQQAIQVSLDVIAHAHQIPLRLLRLSCLRHLDHTFVAFVTQWQLELRSLLTSPLAGNRRAQVPLSEEEADALVAAMKDPRHVATLRDWVLSLATDVPLPTSLPRHYADWFLTLLPHLERDVWLTEMSNPLPVHSLARMVEHWSLFVLMWAWREAEQFQEILDGPSADDANVQRGSLNIRHFGLIVLPGYQRSGRQRPQLDIALVVGPFVTSGADAYGDGGAWFYGPFQRYLSQVSRARVAGWNEVHETAPDRAELVHALEARAGIDEIEAKRRASESQHTLNLLLSARLAPDLFEWKDGQAGRPLSRANWETMAALSCWQARWGPLLQELTPSDTRPLWVGVPRHRVTLQVHRRKGARVEPLLRFITAAGRRQTMPHRHGWVDINDAIRTPQSEGATRWVETPADLHARIRERQSAELSAYVEVMTTALARQSRATEPEGADDPSVAQQADSEGRGVAHLLRGYGDQLCRHILAMTSADLAEIYWCDYSDTAPLLRRVSGAARLMRHRAGLHEDWRRPSEARDAGMEPDPRQAVRAAYSGQIEPRLDSLKSAVAQRKQDSAVHGDPDVKDALSVPLTFNSRVVGVLTLASVAGPRQFGVQLRHPLSVLGRHLGSAIYFQSQLWQMRQINWLASNVELERWQALDFGSPQHPMNATARCLANVFLCPGVNIWLQDRRSKGMRFRLGGGTAVDAFKVNGLLPEHAPSVTLPDVAPRADIPLTRPVFAFALDPWTETDGVDAPGQGDKSLRGHFIQARHDQTVATTLYERASAARGDLVLGADFLSVTGATVPDSSVQMFPSRLDMPYIERGWSNVMAFALIGESAGAEQAIGVVSLNAPDLAEEDSLPPWPPSWRPVVAHIQTYLPYVLAQTEAIDKPMNQLVQYILHQGRNELNAAAVKAAVTKSQLDSLLAVDAPLGQIRPWLRKRIQHSSLGDDAELRHQLKNLEKVLSELATGLEAQASVEHAESLAMLSRLIERRRSIAALGHDLDTAGDVHRAVWLNLRGTIDNSFSAYSSDLKAQRIYLNVDQVDERWLLLSQPRLWSWLLSDLTFNIAKYADPSSGVEVAVDPIEVDGSLSGYRIRFRNEAGYDPNLDSPELLMQFGIQGSAGRRRQQRALGGRKMSRTGTGVGLWGIHELANTLGLKFDIDIKPLLLRPGHARYVFDLSVPIDLLRRDRAN